MLGALLYLRIATLRNLVVYRVRRLRQPKYLFGALAAAAYFYFFWHRRAITGVPEGANSPMAGMTIVAGAGFLFLVGFLRIAFAWIGPVDNPGLRFSEAEIAFLFPAPITRRALVHFRILSSQFGILFASIVAALVTNRFRSAGFPLMRIAGWWVMFSIGDLHVTGAALTRSRVRELGGSLQAWRLGALAVLGLYVAALLGSTFVYGRTPDAADLAGTEAMRSYLAGVFATGPLPWLLLPFSVVAGPLMASGSHEFIGAIIPALLVAAAHYVWVLRTETAFEEGSIAIAERRAAAHAGSGPFGEPPPQAGRLEPAGVPARPVREPFILNSRGRPETAFLWKNLLSIRGFIFTTRIRSMILMAALLLFLGLRLALAGAGRSDKADLSPVVLVVSGLVAFYTLLLGPQLARQDLRSDLPNADILKTYPLAGWQVALGELLAPTAILTAFLWLAILAPALFASNGAAGRIAPGLRITCALCLGAIAPVLCLIQLLVPNLLMVFFPAWYQTSRSRAGGIEAMGQRLIFVFAQLLTAIFAVIPAALAAALIAFASKWLVGTAAAAVLATAAVLAVFGVEAAIGIWILGCRFERLDLSSEFNPQA